MRNAERGARIWAGILLLLCAAAPAGAIGEAYCNIVAVKSDQLTNGARVTIEADGTIPLSLDQLEQYIDFDLRTRLGRWTADVFKATDQIDLRLFNARSHVGSFVYVGKYPISHVEVSVPRGGGGSFNLAVRVYLYRKLRFGRFRKGDMDFNFERYLRDEPRFEISITSDQRKLIITAFSDRQAEIRQRRKVEDVPDGERELRVCFSGGLLDVHAKNARLSDLLKAASQSTGRRMMVDSAADRLVTAELPGVALEEFCARIAECYGLAVDDTAECKVFSDISAGTTSAYTTGSTIQVPLHWLKAGVARDLLPNCVLDYVRVDSERNALTVSGSTALAEKIKADIAKIDRPGKVISIQAVLVESLSTEELMHDLALDYVGALRDYQITFDSAAGSVVYSKVGALNPEFRARLDALAASQKVKIRGDSNVTVLSGQTGEVFAGLNKYIQIQTLYGDSIAVPVAVGAKLTAAAWSGGDVITMSIVSEVGNIGEIDPMTGLPTVVTRTAKGTFRVRSGETMMIGGLSQVQVTSSVRRIPLLGRLPIIGKLFQSGARQRVRSELTVFLTPRVVSAE